MKKLYYSSFFLSMLYLIIHADKFELLFSYFFLSLRLLKLLLPPVLLLAHSFLFDSALLFYPAFFFLYFPFLLFSQFLFAYKLLLNFHLSYPFDFL